MQLWQLQLKRLDKNKQSGREKKTLSFSLSSPPDPPSTRPPFHYPREREAHFLGNLVSWSSGLAPTPMVSSMDDLCGVSGLLSGAYVALGYLALVTSPSVACCACPSTTQLSQDVTGSGMLLSLSTCHSSDLSPVQLLIIHPPVTTCHLLQEVFPKHPCVLALPGLAGPCVPAALFFPVTATSPCAEMAVFPGQLSKGRARPV